MNPAALRNELHRVEQGGTLIINTDTFDERNLEKAGYASNPLTDDSLRGLPGRRGADDLADQGGHGAARREAPRRRPLEELLRPRADLLGLLPADRPGADLDRQALRRQRARPRRPTAPRSRPAGTSARPPRCSTTSTRSSGPTCRRASTRRSPATPPSRGAWWRPASRRNLPVFLGSYPITPASDILHELAKHKNFGVRTLQAEDEIAAVGTASGRGLRRAPRRHHHERAGPGPEERDHQPGHQPRAAAAGHRHPARRALDRAAHQDRGRRPEHGAVRPPRRGAAAGRRGVPPVALLRRRHRGGPHRPEVPHAGDPAVRRVHRQRRRAVEAARRG